jgi:hypothetical protein
MPRIAVEQLVLGPRDEGRRYGVVASSPGLADMAVPAELLDYNLRIGDHVAAQWPVNASFGVTAGGRQLWAISSTWQTGEIAGNRVVVTWILLLNKAQTDLLKQSYLGLGSHIPVGASLPALGSKLPVLRLEADDLSIPPAVGPRLTDGVVRQLAEAAQAPSLRVALTDDLDPQTLIARLTTKHPHLRSISWCTAPLPIRKWGMELYSREAWPDAGGLSFGVRGFNDGSPATPFQRVWSALSVALEDDPIQGQIDAERLNDDLWERASDGDVSDQVRARVLGALKGLSPDQSKEFLIRTMRAAARMEPDSDRRQVISGLLSAMEEWIESSGMASAMIDHFHDEVLADELARIAAPPALMPRLAARGAAAMTLRPTTIAALGEPLTTRFAEILYREAQSTQRDVPESVAALSREWVNWGLPARTWNLGRELLARTAAHAASRSRAGRERSQVLDARELVVKMAVAAAEDGTAGTAATLLRPQRRDDLVDLIGEDGLDRASGSLDAAAVARLRSDPDRSWEFAWTVWTMRRNRGAA